MANESRAFTIEFLKKKQLTADTYSFYFERPNDFNYEPGQYLRMTLEIDSPDERGTNRFFTICSSPTEKEYLMITTRIIQSSFKKTLASLTKENLVKIFGPLGNFIFKEEEKQTHVFLAGGIGITPYRSMIKYMADKKIDTPTILFTSFKTADEIIFQGEFRQMEKVLPRFKFIQTITQSEKSNQKWDGHSGRIDAEWIKQNVFDIPSALFYVSGPGAMVDALSEVIKSLEVSTDNLRTEKFPGY
jgi:ferredoxin-NADP reductase